MWVCKPGTCTGCWLLCGCKDLEGRNFLCPTGLGRHCLCHEETKGHKSVGGAPALGMGVKDWKTPPRSEKPTLWVMSPVRAGSEQEGKITHVPVVSLLVPLPRFVCHQPPAHPDGYQQAINKTSGATGVNILALFRSPCLPLK